MGLHTLQPRRCTKLMKIRSSSIFDKRMMETDFYFIWFQLIITIIAFLSPDFIFPLIIALLLDPSNKIITKGTTHKIVWSKQIITTQTTEDSFPKLPANEFAEDEAHPEPKLIEVYKDVICTLSYQTFTSFSW